ncbi:MAG: hypothetical protein CK424_06760 [Legionella sp.]|nr:MAG: hypothetical protein CK424_06760 [Legionella sp.]
MTKHFTHNSLLPFYLSRQIESSFCCYNLCFSYLVKEQLHVKSIVENLQKLIKLKAHLRQTFALENDKLISHIHQDLPAEIYYHNSSTDELEILEKALINKQHTLTTSSIKLNVIELTDTKNYSLLFNIHHILMDGHTLEQFIGDLNKMIAKEEITHVSDTSYAFQVAQEPPLMEVSDIDLSLTTYNQTIDKMSTDIPFYNMHSSDDILYYSETLPDFIYQKLISTNKQTHISIFNLLLVAWSIFIAKLHDQKHSLVNYPINIRTQKTLQGCFVNYITLPFNFLAQDTYSTTINKCHKKINFFKKLARLKRNSNIKSISSFANSNYAKVKDLVINGKNIPSKGFPQIADSVLSIKYKENEQQLFFSADISSNLFPKYVSSLLLHRFFNFLSKLLNNPYLLLTQIDLTFEAEKNQILYDFNQTKEPFIQDKKLIDLFEEQVLKTPEQLALVFENLKYTYNELNEKSNQLARFLSENYKIKPDDLVALLLDRNEHTIITILAILKTGGAYVPLDLSYPSERISYILQDTQADIIVINEAHQGILSFIFQHAQPETTLKIIKIDSVNTQNEIAKFEKSNLINASTSTNLAYVIYTSGTTGKPKGVMIENHSALNTIVFLTTHVYIRPNTNNPLKMTAFTSYAFDVSVSEFFVPLITGNELHLLSNTLRKDVLLTSQYINLNRINYIYLPPVLLANLPKIEYPSLLGIIYAGEPCDKETASYWSKKINLYNYYGPTETSIYTTGLRLQASEVEIIGKPLSNTTAYVLNADLMPQPIGITGELYIGGAGLARGYLNQAQLTKEKFIPNPFQTNQDKDRSKNFQLYQTGDLVKWTPNGNIEYIGRNDFQVKIRGHRIELGEIEATLMKYSGIKHAIVMVKKSIDTTDNNLNHSFLVGYYVANEHIDELILQEYLSLHLPDYMLPDILIHLTRLPINPNGKLDRTALPAPKFSNTENYIPPTNEREKIICNAFSKILMINKIGIYDNFFKLGGNSIRSISLVSILQNNFDINVADIYHFKTPKKIADSIPFIKNNLKKNLEKIKNHYKAPKTIVENEKKFQEKHDYYLKNIQLLKIEDKKIPINNILLTGATGFLGCNILNVLLDSTSYNVHLIVRANSDADAFARVNLKFKYYFDKCLKAFNNSRLFVFSGNIEEVKLGIPSEKYQYLITKIDSIIHSAALTKHYGDYNIFYSANVQATINLLELSKLTKMKNFHYISTVSVLSEAFIPSVDYYLFTEDDNGDNLKEHSNVYVRTKYEGETITRKYRKYGINSNIYRVGNLAFIARNSRAQENIHENAFYTRLNCLVKLNLVAEEVGIEEISPVDLTAEAIIKLFDKQITHDQTFHIFNPIFCNLGNILSESNLFNVKKVTFNNFISSLVTHLNNPLYQEIIDRYLLHKGWLNEHHNKITSIKVLQDKTSYILKYLGFEWKPISNDSILTYLDKTLCN